CPVQRPAGPAGERAECFRAGPPESDRGFADQRDVPIELGQRGDPEAHRQGCRERGFESDGRLEFDRVAGHSMNRFVRIVVSVLLCLAWIPSAAAFWSKLVGPLKVHQDITRDALSALAFEIDTNAYPFQALDIETINHAHEEADSGEYHPPEHF